MRNMRTNFALLMELTHITPKDINQGLGADPSLISRWRTGSRRLTGRTPWRRRLTEYFLQVREDEVTALMTHLFPIGLSQGLTARQLLERWLGEEELWEEQADLLLSWDKKRPSGSKQKRLTNITSVSGDNAVRKLLKDFLDYVLTQSGPNQIIFYCSDGLELFTKNESYNGLLLENLRSVLKRGKCLQMVLRTNYRASDVALACGPWLYEHLTGRIQSFYYDDFRLLAHGRILFGLRGSLMVQVCMENGTRKAVIHQTPETVSQDEEYFDRCLGHAQQRFCYDFFQDPMDFLCGAAPGMDTTVYLLERFPDIGINFERLSQCLCLSLEETAILREQFWPLTFTLREQNRHARTCHIFCGDMIDEALDGVRHLCRPFSEICGRRLYLSAGRLAKQLEEIRWTLEHRPGYQVCFMPQAWFEQLGMELVAWGSDAAVAWVAGQQSAACRHYPHVAALHGFCATMWDRIPPAQRSRKAALKQLDRWLARARKLGMILE